MTLAGAGRGRLRRSFEGEMLPGVITLDTMMVGPLVIGSTLGLTCIRLYVRMICCILYVILYTLHYTDTLHIQHSQISHYAEFQYYVGLYIQTPYIGLHMQLQFDGPRGRHPTAGPRVLSSRGRHTT